MSSDQLSFGRVGSISDGASYGGRGRAEEPRDRGENEIEIRRTGLVLLNTAHERSPERENA
jgi:hypothetical protein